MRGFRQKFLGFVWWYMFGSMFIEGRQMWMTGIMDYIEDSWYSNLQHCKSEREGASQILLIGEP